MTKQCGIYIITNTVNGKRYVGSSDNIPRRWREHKKGLRHNRHKNAHLQSAWNKYSEKFFTFEVALLCEVCDLFYYEQAYMDILKPEYNKAICAKASMRGKHHTDETRAKQSAASKGNHYGLGYKHTEEARRKQSERMKGNSLNHWGYKRTEEARRKQSERQKGIPRTDEEKRKVSTGMKAYWAERKANQTKL